jgi:hypothetical protein
LEIALERQACSIGNATFHIGGIKPTDSPEVLKLFAVAFGSSADDRWFHWKQCDSTTKAIGLWDQDDSLVAYYSGVPRHMIWQGKKLKGVQIGDVMVTPKLRGILSRKGPFYQVCSNFLDTFVGENKAFSFAFGFPNDRAMALGELLGFYRRTTDILQLSWKTEHASLGFPWRCQQLNTKHGAFAKIADKLWLTMQKGQGNYVMGERNSAYLQWRFIDRPDKEYFFFCLQHWWGKPAALIVLTKNPEGIELLDVIGKHQYLSKAIEAAQVKTKAIGYDTITAWASPLVADLIGVNAIIAPSGATMPIDTMSPLSDQLHGEKWWWLGGDTDFR